MDLFIGILVSLNLNHKKIKYKKNYWVINKYINCIIRKKPINTLINVEQKNNILKNASFSRLSEKINTFNFSNEMWRGINKIKNMDNDKQLVNVSLEIAEYIKMNIYSRRIVKISNKTKLISDIFILLIYLHFKSIFNF